MPIDESDKWHLEAIRREDAQATPPNTGTYELVGSKVQGNAEKYARHLMIEHAAAEHLSISFIGYDHLKTWLNENYMEEIVWHHPDGRMAKIKRRDYGLKWP